MRYLFTEEDLYALDRRIRDIRERVKSAAREMGLSCQEGAETFHDNFAYEQGDRDHRMWSTQLRKLLHIRENADIVMPPLTDKISIGHTVKIQDIDSMETRSFKIGSYMVLHDLLGDNGRKHAGGVEEAPVLSYEAPLAKAFMGAREGDYGHVVLQGKERRFLVLKVEYKG